MNEGVASAYTQKKKTQLSGPVADPRYSGRLWAQVEISLLPHCVMLRESGAWKVGEDACMLHAL